MSEAKVYQAIMRTPLGPIGIQMNGQAVSALDYLSTDTPEQSPVNAAAEAVLLQLRAYFHDGQSPLELVVAPNGTAFQRRVWTALEAIPVGATLTYGELARQLGTAARAIGGACRSNPIPILIPCHRIVSRQNLGGYAGEVTGNQLEIKRWLLQHEGVMID